VIVAVPPLHAIVPAEEDTPRPQATAAITVIDVVEVLSALLSPVKLPGIAHDVPFENNSWPLTVDGPPIEFPCSLIKIWR
jgi:hypothetical protein